VHPVDGESRDRLSCAALMNSPRKLGPGGLRRGVHRGLDLLVGGDFAPPGPCVAAGQTQPRAPPLDVVVSQVEAWLIFGSDSSHVGAVLVALEQLALDDPVDLGVDLGEVPGLSTGVEAAVPTGRPPARSASSAPAVCRYSNRAGRSSTPAWDVPARWACPPAGQAATGAPARSGRG